MDKPIIRETIVVEGYHDASAVKAAVAAEIIITSGFGIKEATYQRIAWAQAHGGVIILTDPDHVGEQIRKRIEGRVPGVKHAWIRRHEGLKDGDVGVENASPEAIREALEAVRTAPETHAAESYTEADMVRWGLSGGAGASERRDLLGKRLGIGYGNSRQFLSRLNHYGIDRKTIEQALEAF